MLKVESCTSDSTGSQARQLVALSLRANVTWTLVGNLVYAGCQWGTLVVLARMSNPELVGTLALAMAITAPVFMLLNLQLRVIQATDATFLYSFGTIWSLRVCTSLLALALIGAYLFVAPVDALLLSVVSSIAVAKVFEALSDAIHGRVQQQERLDWVARSVALRGALTLTLLSATFFVTQSLSLAAASASIASLLPLLLIDLPILRRLDIRSPSGKPAQMSFFPRMQYSRSEMGLVLRSGVPLGIGMMILSVTLNVPRYFIEAHWGRSELGTFAAFAQLVAAGGMVVSAAGQSAGPRLARYIAQGKVVLFRRLLSKLYLLVALVSLSGLGISYFLGEMIVEAIFPPSFWQSAGLLVPLSVAGWAMFAGTVTGIGLTAAGYHRVQLPLAVLVIAVGLLASTILIPAYGLWGASVVLIVTYGVKSVAGYVVLSWCVYRRRNEADVS